MKKIFLILVGFGLGLVIAPVLDLPGIAAQTVSEKGQEAKSRSPKESPEEKAKEEKPVITDHTLFIHDRTISYQATAGRLPVQDASGKTIGKIFFVAYTQEKQDRHRRPVTFVFNGGPGAASIFLHMGALGPKRVLLTPQGGAPPAPYRTVENSYSWLDLTDLVFIDPVGTGYSRPSQDKDRKDFFGVKQDIRSVGEFIRLFVTKYDRWLSPKFLAGESYGTTRAAGLAGYLQNELAMHLNGIILISSVLDFQTITFVPGNDWPFILYLPAYTNAAGYHKKLPPELLQDMEKTRHAVEKFAMGEYLLALARGDGLAEKERRHVVNQLVRYTGLGEIYIRNHNLRIPRDGFVGELLRREKRTLGVLDARLTAPYKPQSFLEDPSVFAVVGPLVAAWNDYVRRELKYESDRPYKFLSQRANRAWKWGSAEEGFLNVAGTLKRAVSANPYLQVLMASGYYDLDTSYFATKYTVGHLNLEPRLRPNITLTYYEAGHQMYTRLDSLKKLKEDVSRFISQSIRKR